MSEVGLINVTIKRKSKKKAGFEVEKREEDGFYYITKVPKNCTKIGVGDRVLEINGTMHKDFKSQTNANDLVDTLRLEVVPVDDDDSQEDDSEEEYEVINRSGSKARNPPPMPFPEVDGRNSRSKHVESRGEVDEDDSWSDDGEMKSEELDWNNDSFNNNEKYARNVNAGQQKLEKTKSWDRPYVSNYKPNERFMITVTKKEENEDDDLGIDLVEFQENEIYVSEVNPGPFYETALNRGDKIISINGKKIANDIDTVEEAMDILDSHSKITLFVLRPKTNDKGLKWVNENFED